MVCRICAHRDQHPTYQAREMMYGSREAFTYFQCGRCGCLQITDVPEDMATYYPPAYYTSTLPWTSPDPSSKALTALRTLRNRYALLGSGVAGRLLYRWQPSPAYRDWTAARFPGEGVRRIGLTPMSRVLDLGCGAGELLLALHDAGFRHLLGVDAYADGQHLATAGLPPPLRSIHDVTGRWDLIMFQHSFEHLRDPHGALTAAARLLRPGGHCLIRLPVVSSYAWEHYGVDWVQLDAPRHFFLHSEESMRRLAAGAGLEIAAIIYDSTRFQFVGSELYRRGIPLRSPDPADMHARADAFSPDDLLAFDQRARQLNVAKRGDQAAFYLRKPRPADRTAAASCRQ